MPKIILARVKFEFCTPVLTSCDLFCLFVNFLHLLNTANIVILGVPSNGRLRGEDYGSKRIIRQNPSHPKTLNGCPNRRRKSGDETESQHLDHRSLRYRANLRRSHCNVQSCSQASSHRKFFLHFPFTHSGSFLNDVTRAMLHQYFLDKIRTKRDKGRSIDLKKIRNFVTSSKQSQI